MSDDRIVSCCIPTDDLTDGTFKCFEVPSDLPDLIKSLIILNNA
jgi:hypothetical protein